MKKLHTFGVWERPLAGLFKDRLEQEGIRCLVKNNDLFSVMGEIPMVECFPELWIVDSETYPRASMLLNAWLLDNSDPGSDWVCSQCLEEVDGAFEVCWNCNRPRQQPPD